MHKTNSFVERSVVTIAGFNFNKDLDSYIEKRKKNNEPFEIGKAQPRAEMTDDDYDEPERKNNKKLNLSSILRRRIPSEDEIESENKKRAKAKEEELEKEIEDLDEAEDEIEAEKESIFQKLGKIFGGSRKEELYEEAEIEVVEQEQAALNEEVKETLKIVHKWLEQLPPEKLERFKRSPDFARYKELLRNLGLIKK